MADISWPMVVIAAILLLFVFFLYLMIRRTVTAFTAGLREGSRRD